MSCGVGFSSVLASSKIAWGDSLKMSDDHGDDTEAEQFLSDMTMAKALSLGDTKKADEGSRDSVQFVGAHSSPSAVVTPEASAMSKVESLAGSDAKGRRVLQRRKSGSGGELLWCRAGKITQHKSLFWKRADRHPASVFAQVFIWRLSQLK